MKIDWESAPVWPFYTVLYLLAGFVVVRSARLEVSRQCDASSPISVQQQLVMGAAWPATAVLMMVAHQDPLSSVFGPPLPPRPPGA